MNFVASNVPLGLVPLSLPDPSRVEGSKRNNSYRNHSTFKDHESDFIVGQGPVEPTGQLGATEDRSNEDGDGGSGQANHPVLERSVAA